MKLLTLGAALSFTAAAAEAGIALTEAPAYRHLHAASVQALAAEGGSWNSALFTLMVATLLAVWGLYALAASGRIAPLPLMGPAIHGIAAIYFIRGMFLFPQLLGHNLFNTRYTVTTGDLAISAILLVIGLVHLAGSNARQAPLA